MHENCHHKIIYKSDLKMFCRTVMHYQDANTALVKMNKCKYKCFPRFSFASPLLLLSWENYLNGGLNKIKNWVYHQCKIIFNLDVLKQVQELSWTHFRMPLDHKLTFNDHIGNVLVKKNIYLYLQNATGVMQWLVKHRLQHILLQQPSLLSMSFVCSPLDVDVVIYEYAYNWSAHAMLKLHQYNVTLAITRTNERSLEEKLIEE